MKCIAIAVLAACGSSSSPSPPAEPPPAPKPVAPPPADAAVPVAKPSLPFRVQLPPSGDIAFVAVTPDGDAVLVADETNGYRLYAALDGSQEPVWVELPAAFAFAVIRDGDGFVAALLDDASGLVIAAFDRDGRVTRHSELAGPFVAITASSAGFVATKDHAIDVIERNAVVHELAAPDDDPLGEIAVAKDRAAVIVETKKGKRVRRLALSPPAWSGWIADGLVAIALSPSGERLAGIAGDKAVVVDVATGKQLASRQATADSRVGFADDGQVAIAGPGTQLAWLGMDPKESAATAMRSAGSAREPPVLAVGGSRAVTRVGGDLAIATPAEIRYLGYRIPNAAHVAPAGGDRLLVGDKEWAIVDGKLDVVATPKLWAPADHDLVTVQHLAGDDWLVTAQGREGFTLWLDDVTAGTGRAAYGKPAAAAIELSSHLVVLSVASEREVELVRYVPDRHAFDKLGKLARASDTLIYPVSPKLSGGIELVAVEQRCETGCKLRWFRDLAHLDRSIDLDTHGYAFTAGDPAGHVFVSQDDAGKRQLAVYADGKLHATRADNDRMVLPDPTGQRYVSMSLWLGPTTIALTALDGPELWSHPANTMMRPLWLEDGGLALAESHGVIRLDVATGEPIVARCGWRFELAAQPGDTAHVDDSPCKTVAAKRDVIAIPGDAAFQKLATDVATKSSAMIYEWGSYSIAGRPHRAATIVRNDLVGLLVELAPGKVIDLVFRPSGRTDYKRRAGSQLQWIVGRRAATGTWTTAFAAGEIAFHSKAAAGSETIDITLRGDTPVVTGTSWVDRVPRKDGLMDETHGDKSFATGTPVADFSPHAAKITVRGPSANADDVLVAPDPAWK